MYDLTRVWYLHTVCVSLPRLVHSQSLLVPLHPSASHDHDVHRYGWNIGAASHNVPQTSCMPRERGDYQMFQVLSALGWGMSVLV